MSDESDIEDIKEQKMQELQDQADEDQQEQLEQQREQAEAQKQAILRQHLTDGARKRLNTVKMSKPDFGEKVEQQVVTLARSGRVQDRIDEEQMKELLKELQPDDDGYNVRRR